MTPNHDLSLASTRILGPAPATNPALAGLLCTVGLGLCVLGLLGCASGPSAPSPGAADAGAQPTVDATPSSSGLPMVVDDYYAASGYMGDGAQPGAVVDNECTGARAGDGRGHCHQFVWTPGSMSWAGVFWQFPAGNWGDQPGLDVPAGATQVSFYAWGKQGGEVVGFMVGMSDVDGFEVKKENISLSAEPTRYTLSLDGTSYGAVVGGFGWVAADSPSAIGFSVDDIVWE